MCFIGYLAWEYPTNRLLQRLPLGKYSAACILIWGAILCCFAAVNNYPGAIAIRFMLGVFEAAVTPGFALLTSQVCNISRPHKPYTQAQDLANKDSGIPNANKEAVSTSGSASTAWAKFSAA
jgi:MFS family permease